MAGSAMKAPIGTVTRAATTSERTQGSPHSTLAAENATQPMAAKPTCASETWFELLTSSPNDKKSTRLLSAIVNDDSLAPNQSGPEMSTTSSNTAPTTWTLAGARQTGAGRARLIRR